MEELTLQCYVGMVVQVHLLSFVLQGAGMIQLKRCLISNQVDKISDKSKRLVWNRRPVC